MKRTAISALVAALVFGLLSTWLGPRMITYYYDPPVPTPMNCTPAVSWAMQKLVMTQLVGTIAGAVIGLIIGILLARRAHPVAPPPAAVVPQPPAKV